MEKWKWTKIALGLFVLITLIAFVISIIDKPTPDPIAHFDHWKYEGWIEHPETKVWTIEVDKCQYIVITKTASYAGTTMVHKENCPNHSPK